MKPLIGITANYLYEDAAFSLRDYYVNAVTAAGAVPIILPALGQEELVNEYLEICDGFVFSGGGDPDPAYFGQSPAAQLGEINPRRDEFEISLARKVLALKKPALGICRGCQIMNIAAGGTLNQHLETGMCHMQNAPRDYPFHDILIKSGSRLASIVESKQIRVNSFHHQAVDQPGKGIYITARAQDGTAEALEASGDLFYLGVQWHPECMSDQHAISLFTALAAKSEHS